MNPKLNEIHARLRTPKTDDGRIPFHPILMMHASHVSGMTYEELMRDHKKLVAANLKCLELYDHDAVSVISDPYRETAAFGAAIRFAGNDSPSAEKIVHDRTDIDRLSLPDVYAHERTLDRIEGVLLFRRELGSRFPVIGWVEGPLAEAADLMGMSEAMMQMMLAPDDIHALCDKTLAMGKAFAAAQIEAGADIVGVGDAICSQIPPDMYESFAFDRHRELFDFIHEKGALVKLHICGDITHLLPLIAREGADILDIDWMVDMAAAHRAMGPDVMLSGNLDPVAVILEGDRERVGAAYETVRNSVPAENWILSGGCEIPMMTPQENMVLLRQLSL